MTDRSYQRFETTAWGQVIDAGRLSQARDEEEKESAQKALNELCCRYWMPLYSFAKSRGFDHHETQDLIQEFFAALFRREAIAQADPTKGRFRSFLLTALKNFIASWSEYKRAQKRDFRREQQAVSIDFDSITNAPACSSDDPFRVFQQRWAETIMQNSLETLRQDAAERGRSDEFSKLFSFLFTSEAQPEMTYQQVAQQLNISDSQVRLLVHRYRKRLAEVIRAEIRETVHDEEEVEAELSELIVALSSRSTS